MSSARSTLLVADDDIDELATIVDYLGERDFRILTAVTAAQVYDLAQRSHLDMVLISDSLAQAGLTRLAQQRRINEDENGIPIVVITDRSDVAAIEQCYALGAADYLGKPLCRPELLARVTGLLVNRRASTSPTQPMHSGPQVPDDRPASGVRVLVIEDHEVSAMVTRAYLAELGYAAEIATTGEKALAHWRDFNVLLCDCSLPDCDGREITRRIRALEQEERRSPRIIVAMSGDVRPEDRLACSDAGMNGFLPKPFTIEILASTMLAHVPRS